MVKQRPIIAQISSASPSYSGVIYMHKMAAQRLKLDTGSQVQVKFGCQQVTIRVLYPYKYLPETISLSRDVREKLRIPEQQTRFHVYAEDEKSIRLGPVIGIMAHVRERNGALIGMQVPVFERLLSVASNEHMFAYIFSPEEIQWESGLLRGWFLEEREERKRWVKGTLPLPDVIYDQIISRSFEKKRKVVESKEKLLKLYGSRYFNPGFFDKWQVHTWLANDSRMKEFLPVTILHDSREKTIRFLEAFHSSYIKPIHGSLGVGILKIVRLHDGRYAYQLKEKKGVLKEGVVQTPAQIVDLFHKHWKKHKYVIQQGLNLLSIDHRPFDIRILMQKDQTGKWRRTKSFCRIAQPGDFTSNLSTGGDALPVASVLQKICKHNFEITQIQRKIHHLSRVLPLVIEEQSGLSLGELGLDIGIDENRLLWVIEVNAKPWKKPMTQNGSQQLVLQSFRRPMLYAKYLSGL